MTREPACVFDRIPADMCDDCQPVCRPGRGPAVVQREAFLARQRMTFSRRTSDEDATNAIRGEKCRLNRDDINSDAAIGVEWCVNGGDEVMKRTSQIDLQTMTCGFRLQAEVSSAYRGLINSTKRMEMIAALANTEKTPNSGT